MKPPERISTERLILRKPVMQDAAVIFETYAQDPEVTRYLPWRPHSGLPQTIEFLTGCVDAWKGEQRFPYVMTIKEGNILIGMIDLRVNGFKADVGYGIGKAWWGQGFTTEALSGIIHWALAQDLIFRVEATCDVDNLASARVMEKAGMQKEGTLHRWIVHPAISPEPRDSFLYAVVK